MLARVPEEGKSRLGSKRGRKLRNAPLARPSPQTLVRVMNAPLARGPSPQTLVQVVSMSGACVIPELIISDGMFAISNLASKIENEAAITRASFQLTSCTGEILSDVLTLDQLPEEMFQPENNFVSDKNEADHESSVLARKLTITFVRKMTKAPGGRLSNPPVPRERLGRASGELGANWAKNLVPQMSKSPGGRLSNLLVPRKRQGRGSDEFDAAWTEDFWDSEAEESVPKRRAFSCEARFHTSAIVTNALVRGALDLPCMPMPRRVEGCVLAEISMLGPSSATVLPQSIQVALRKHGLPY